MIAQRSRGCLQIQGKCCAFSAEMPAKTDKLEGGTEGGLRVCEGSVVQRTFRWKQGILSSNRIVIPTGAYPDFLPRSTGQGPRVRLSVRKAA